nr:hypothetical protein Iba_chr06aCG12630 [Ipomoea batatas]GMD43492.1 hypothetical protein Iba_chr10cCG5840 [Ipomoea batatas]GMD46613.1 hypothetical protein Iba_chr10eCG4980 [Ipomoea batatas]
MSMLAILSPSFSLIATEPRVCLPCALTCHKRLKITIAFCEAIATKSSLVQRLTHLSSSPGTCQVKVLCVDLIEEKKFKDTFFI